MRENQSLIFYQTQEEACGYLPDLRSRNLLADPYFPMSAEVYQQLIARGFRRSGAHVYRPFCEHCSSCIPVRVPVAAFKPNRSQRRCLRANVDLQVHSRAGHYSEEYFALYTRYLDNRHPDGGMENPTAESFQRFLLADWCDTQFIEFRQAGELLAVAVCDQLPEALSAVYTFFDPALPSQRALGKLAVLWQISEAQRLGLTHLYLGYWIRDCSKMSYKTDYRPLEYYDGERWCSFPDRPRR